MKRFSELLFEAMDETLRHVFGKSASELIYTLVEGQVQLNREEIAERTEDFFAYLEKLLGSERAHIIQAAGFKRLYLKLQQEYEEVEGYFSVLDELYETKFKLLASHLEQDRSVCS